MWNWGYVGWLNCFYYWCFLFSEVGGCCSEYYTPVSIRFTSKADVKDNSSFGYTLFRVGVCLFLGW